MPFFFRIVNSLSITPLNVTLCDEGESRLSSLAKVAFFTVILSFRSIRLTNVHFCKEIKANKTSGLRLIKHHAMSGDTVL
jgi:hypothetical protein